MSRADENLLIAIAFIDNPGVSGNYIRKMELAIDNGADVDGVTEDGQTPLTAAIEGGMGSPSAVKFLIENGADPDKRDDNGWTPWGICLSRIDDRPVAQKMAVIKSLLEAANADRADEYFLNFNKAILGGDFDRVRKCLEEDIDLSNPIADALGCAIYRKNVEMARLLLAAGADVDHRADDDMSPLIFSASQGDREIVELLLEYGADVSKVAWGDSRCTAEFMARENGHETLANWLRDRSGAVPVKQLTTQKKYQALFDKSTDAINFDLTTEDIVARLQEWDKHYKISISNVERDSLIVEFTHLPTDLSELAKDIYKFCPDTIDQGYGCMDDMVKMASASGQAPDADVLQLVDGIDFSDEDFGLEILERDLKRQKKLLLWWD